MALRRAGGATLLLLRVYGTSGPSLQQQGRALTAQALPAVLQLSAHGSGHFRSRQWWQEQQQQLPTVEGLWLRHLATAADSSSKQEGGEKPSAGASSGQAASPPAAAAPARKPLPGAQDCDDAIESYTRTRSAYHNLAPPSTYRTASQRLVDFLAVAVNGTISVVGWCVAVPGRLWALRSWSRDDWSAWWGRVKKVTKDEAHHYWVGFKLLAFDVRVASGLGLKAMRGNQLTRRERRQLTRTTADMFRLVPMIIILLIPFLELALPLLLKLFPNMLPSTFEDKLKKEEEVKKRLVIKMEVAKFLQDTVAEMAKDIKAKRSGETSASAAELYAFINRVRAGAEVSNADLIRFASLFNDELTLDNLDRVQLVSMCTLLGIPVYGTDGYLKHRLRTHLANAKQDDRLIQTEGLDSLTEDELRTACKTRGLKAAYGAGAKDYMRRQMQNWLDLSLNHGLPSSLLLLSRAFTITTPVESAAARGTGAAAVANDELGRVRETLLTLPEEVIQDVGLEVAAATTSAEDLHKRLLIMQKEQKLIQEEAQAAQLEAAASAPAAMAGAHVGGSDASASAAAAAAAAAPEPHAAAQQQPGGEAQAAHAAAVAAAAAVWNEASASALKDVIAAEGISEEQRAEGIAAAREQRMQQLLYAITVLASSSGVATERAAFMDLVRQQVSQLQETHGTETTSLTFSHGSLHAIRPEEVTDKLARELVAPRRLEERVNGILLRLERELDQADEAIGERLHVLDMDNDGLISAGELTEALRFLKANLDEQDLNALLERLEIKAEGGAGQPLIPVAELVKLAESKEGGSSSSSSSPAAAAASTLLAHASAKAGASSAASAAK